MFDVVVSPSIGPMTPSEIDVALRSALAGRRLLEHPFYRRWEAGQVSISELSAYAGQYRHFETYLPCFLEHLAESLPEGGARDLVEANLTDEKGDPVPHVELFEHFATAVGAGAHAASPAMTALLTTYDDLLSQDPVSGLAGFLAYEGQAADVARAKGEGLRRHYGLDDQAVSFWEHHAKVDVHHRDWTKTALAGSVPPHDVVSDLRQAADAWWAFLEEREDLVQAETS